MCLITSIFQMQTNQLWELAILVLIENLSHITNNVYIDISYNNVLHDDQVLRAIMCRDKKCLGYFKLNFSR